jgi:hypothetical protein
MNTHKLSAMALLAVTLSIAFTASQAATGELWETHGTMEGAAFGRTDLGTHRECRAKKVERRGNGYVWIFDCGKTRGEGSARMTGDGLMETSMQMDTPQGHFTLKLHSRKLGACKVGERG